MGRRVAASQSRAAAVAHGEEGLAVGTERHRVDRRLMHEGLTDGTMRGGVAESRHVVAAPGENDLAVGAISQAPDVLPPIREGRSDGLAGGGIPESRLSCRGYE